MSKDGCRYSLRYTSPKRNDNRVIRHLEQVATLLSKTNELLTGHEAAAIVYAYMLEKKAKDEARVACAERRKGAKLSSVEAGFRDASVSPSGFQDENRASR
jgi:hypothetical protein